MFCRSVVLAISLAFFFKQQVLAESWPASDPKCSFLKGGGEVLTGTLPRRGKDNIRLRIPKLYLPGPFYPPNGMIGHDGAVLMYIHKDTMQPYSLKDMHGKIAAGKQDWISILINYRADLSAVKDVQLSIFAKSGNAKPLAIEYGYGLLSFEVLPRRGGKDIFFHQERNQPTDVISCSRPPERSSDGKYPQCIHYTSVPPDIDVDLGYSRVYLPNWQEIKANAASVVRCVVQQ